MATFFDREPDYVYHIGPELNLQYCFKYYAPSEHKEVGTILVVVCSPGLGRKKAKLQSMI